MMRKLTLKTITLFASLSLAGAFCYAEQASAPPNDSATTADQMKSDSTSTQSAVQAHPDAAAPQQAALTTAETVKPESAMSQNPALNTEQVKEVQKIIHDYLLQNPELMVQVFRKLQEQQQVEMEKKAVNAISANFQKIFENTASPVVGNANAKITLVEFFDYQCPHCKIMARVVEGILKKDKNLRVVFKELPIFPGSNYAAQAALAAANQGKYYEFHNALMGASNPLTKHDVIEIARKSGLNLQQLEKDMQKAEIKQEVQSNLNLAETLGLAGTPAFIVQNTTDKTKTFFVPGQVSSEALLGLIKKAE